jgi:hypothetical protein
MFTLLNLPYYFSFTMADMRDVLCPVLCGLLTYETELTDPMRMLLVQAAEQAIVCDRLVVVIDVIVILYS